MGLTKVKSAENLRAELIFDFSDQPAGPIYPHEGAAIRFMSDQQGLFCRRPRIGRPAAFGGGLYLIVLGAAGGRPDLLALVPRVVAPLFLEAVALFLLLRFPACREPGARKRPFYLGGGWMAYGRIGEGTGYAPLDQITRENVCPTGKGPGNPARRHRRRQAGQGGSEHADFRGGQAVSLLSQQQGDSDRSATGKIVWQFDPHTTAPFWQRCHAIGFVPARDRDSDCGDRVVVATVDRWMIARHAECLGTDGVRPRPGSGLSADGQCHAGLLGRRTAEFR